MKALVQKEIRLLAPAYGLALLLAVVSPWLLAGEPDVLILPFWFGAMMLALSSFGREFGLRTFPLNLAQPFERQRLWRTKVAVLAGGLATAFAGWCLACAASFPLGMKSSDRWSSLGTGGLLAIVTCVGALWTTLLLRQVIAAFWFTILVPLAVFGIVHVLGGSDAMVVTALCLYCVLGFFWARRLFFRFQEAGWTGGVISFPGWRTRRPAAQPALRRHRPLAALFWKELQLHEFSLLAVAWLFLMHLGVAAVRRFGHDSLGETVRLALEVFGGLWLIVPLLVGSLSVAEERNLGVATELLCLPISRRPQFFLKLLFVLVLGGVLSALLLWTAEGLGCTVIGNSTIEAFKKPFRAETLVRFSPLCLGLSLVGFYASTLTRSVLQAVGAAVALAASVFGAWSLAATIGVGRLPVFGFHLWLGPLVFYFALPILVGTLLALAYGNFRAGAENRPLWPRNLLSLVGALLLIATLTTANFYRAWELVTPIEPEHGPDRLLVSTAARRLVLQGDGNFTLSALLPNGRLWVDRAGYDRGRLVLAFGARSGFRMGGKWGSLSGSQMAPGSNWIAVAADYRQTVAVRADGTLWVSKTPRFGRYRNQAEMAAFEWFSGMRRTPPFEEAAPLVRFGQETNWRSVVRYEWESSVILQKRDGTLWYWYPDHPVPNDSEWLGLRSFEPNRLGTESDWASILSASSGVDAWKKDGRAWVIHPASRKPRAEELPLAPGVVLERAATFDNFRWLSSAPCGAWEAAVRDDGTLWAWIMVYDPHSGSFRARPPARIGKDTDWRAVAGHFGSLASLKADGSLWQWTQSSEYPGRFDLETAAPVRLGTHHDWIGVGVLINDTVSLAADGSLWYWPSQSLRDFAYRQEADQPMLAPSRRPARIENILDAQRPGRAGQ